MRLIACAVILAGCGYLGAVFAGAFKKRTESLMLMSDALRQLEFDIDFLSVTLAESFERIALNFDGAVGQVFEYTAARMKKAPTSLIYGTRQYRRTAASFICARATVPYLPSLHETSARGTGKARKTISAPR